jgi:hypothetical protein
MAVETAPAPAAYDEWRDRRWRLTGLAFAVLWLVTAVLLVQLGEKRSDLNQLSASISEGSVTQVEVVGAPQERWRGGTVVTLRWQGSVLTRFAQVTVYGDRAPNRTAEGDHVVGDPGEYLQTIAFPQELDITYADRPSYREWHGWRGPDVPYVAALAAWFGTILLAGAGPQPWRATSWAWIWLILFSGPLGSVAYLLLGGPLGMGRPRNPERRLTGGWAFLIGVVLLGGSSSGA